MGCQPAIEIRLFAQNRIVGHHRLRVRIISAKRFLLIKTIGIGNQIEIVWNKTESTEDKFVELGFGF
jgi:hypothetical protein